MISHIFFLIDIKYKLVYDNSLQVIVIQIIISSKARWTVLQTNFYFIIFFINSNFPLVKIKKFNAEKLKKIVVDLTVSNLQIKILVGYYILIQYILLQYTYIVYFEHQIIKMHLKRMGFFFLKLKKKTYCICLRTLSEF